MLRWFRNSVLVLVVLLFNGCMVGPKYVRPKVPADSSSFIYGRGYTDDVNQLQASCRWWMRFGDAATTELVIKALANNWDLKAAAARVLQAQAALAEVRAVQWPAITYNLNRNRQKLSFNFGTGRASALITTYSQDISVVYVLDLFGKLKHSERAAWAELLASQANKAALINSIIASTIKARIDIATLEKQLAIARADTENWRKTLSIVEQRYRQGLASPLDVRLTKESLAASELLQTDLQLQLIKAYNALDVLLGHRPGYTDTPIGEFEELGDLEPVPVGLPVSLLDRRPDVIAAEMSLKAANEQIGVSIAQLYPDLTLTGSLGRSADTFRDIFRSETEVYSLVMSLAQPIFRGGQLKAQVEAAKARYSELAANYAQTVLTAIREVEDALASEQMLQEQISQAKQRLAEARAAEELARQRYTQGLEGILVVLESERSRRAAEQELINLKSQLWTTRVNLFLALGGDWIGSMEQAKIVSASYSKD